METIKTKNKLFFSKVNTPNKHPNALSFTGTVMKLNEPSSGCPDNTMNVYKPIVMSDEVAKKAADSMKMMAIDCVWDGDNGTENMTGHDSTNKVGVVVNCYVIGNELKIDGIIYAIDFPKVADFIKANKSEMGFSVEMLCDVVEDEDVIRVDSAEFTGVAILFKEMAAYKSTYIDYIAAKRKDINKTMDETKFKETITEALASTAKVFAEEVGKALEPIKESLNKYEKVATEASAVVVKEAEPIKIDSEAVARLDKLETLVNEKFEKLEKTFASMKEEAEKVEASAVKEVEEVVTPDVQTKKTSTKFESADATAPKSFADCVRLAINK